MSLESHWQFFFSGMGLMAAIWILAHHFRIAHPTKDKADK